MRSEQARAASALLAALAVAAALPSARLERAAGGERAGPALRFSVFSRRVRAPNSVVWTGDHLLAVENTANVVWSLSQNGRTATRVGSMPRAVEEARCALSPGAHGFPPGAVFCHSPDHRIWKLDPARGSRKLFAILPVPAAPADDGALDFDRVGRFGFELIAATGRSGAGEALGGTVYAIDPRGRVRAVGPYAGGGADELIVAPKSFGSASGDVLLAADAGAGGGTVVAVAPAGTTRVLASLPDGPNPIAALDGLRRARRGSGPRLYLTDDASNSVYVASAAPLRQYAGDVLVGSEVRALFWLIEPRGPDFAVVPVASNFRAPVHSLEQMILVP